MRLKCLPPLLRRRRPFFVLLTLISLFFFFYFFVVYSGDRENLATNGGNFCPIERRLPPPPFHQQKIRFPSARHPSFKYQCSDVLAGIPEAVAAAKNFTYCSLYSPESLLAITDDCPSLRRHFSFPDRPLTDEEQNYSLAYTLIVYKNAEQVIRQLSAVYWPQNLYCLTYDTKAGERFKATMRGLTRCFPNVVMPDEHVRVDYGGYGVLKAAMHCLRRLHAVTEHPWRYHQILSGTTLPLRTNYEMVRIFQSLNGSFNSEFSAVDLRRTTWKWTPPPGNLTLIKSNFAVLFSREAAAFIVTDALVQRFYRWLDGTNVPDELFWATVAGNPQVLKMPGGWTGVHLVNDHDRPYFLPRYSVWRTWGKCNGQWTHRSCVFGVADLGTLLRRPELMVHKVSLDNGFEPALFCCLTEAVTERAYNQTPFDVGFYERLDDNRRPADRQTNLYSSSFQMNWVNSFVARLFSWW